MPLLILLLILIAILAGGFWVSPWVWILLLAVVLLAFSSYGRSRW